MQELQERLNQLETSLFYLSMSDCFTDEERTEYRELNREISKIEREIAELKN